MTPPDSNGDDFAAMLEEFEQRSPGHGRAGPAVGDVVVGTVISIGDEAVFVDLGGKSEGMLALDQVVDRSGELIVAVGDRIESRVAETGERSGIVVLRRSLGKGPDARAELEQAFVHHIPVDGLVSASIKGGFEVQVAGVRAFCPISQIDDKFVEEPETFVGQRFSFRITRFEGGRGGRANIVLSRRALLEEDRAARAAETRAVLEVGLVVKGTVSSIKDYGAFVDIGGLEGMLHISELGFSRTNHPGDVLRVGQAIEVQILSIEKTSDPKRPEKIGLSLKALERDPWEDLVARLGPGSTVRGPVVKIQSFGAFVELVPGVEGLIHISEMGGGKRINSPREVVKSGQIVEVTVLSIDEERRRISLSLDAATRVAEAAEEAEAVASHSGKSQSLGTLGDLLGKLGKK